MQTKKITIKRYDFNKIFISEGILTIVSEGQLTTLTYTDNVIEEIVTGLYHPLSVFESLRVILETKYQSLLGCNGCRIDTSYRATGGWGIYKIEYGKQATESLNIFEPTDEIKRICTVADLKEAYKKWLDSLK